MRTRQAPGARTRPLALRSYQTPRGTRPAQLLDWPGIAYVGLPQVSRLFGADLHRTLGLGVPFDSSLDPLLDARITLGVSRRAYRRSGDGVLAVEAVAIEGTREPR